DPAINGEATLGTGGQGALHASRRAIGAGHAKATPTQIGHVATYAAAHIKYERTRGQAVCPFNHRVIRCCETREPIWNTVTVPDHLPADVVHSRDLVQVCFSFSMRSVAPLYRLRQC